MSAGPVNLNKFRKSRARQQERRQAEANSVKFGRSKAEREADRAAAVREKARTEAHKLDKPE